MKNFNIINEAIETLSLNSITGKYRGEDFLIVGSNDEFEQLNQYLASHYAELLKDKKAYQDPVDYFTDDNQGFADQYARCYECDTIYCYYPSSGEPDFSFGGYCEKCIRENCQEEYLEHLEITQPMKNQLPMNKLFSDEELKQFGYEKLEDDLTIGIYSENEMHNTDPVSLLEQIFTKKPNSKVIFNSGSYNPYTINYEVWIKEEKDNE